MSWQRARSPHQIEQRRQNILEAVSRLYDSRDIEDITLTSIGKEVGLAKSNLYRYFESREAILLELYVADVHGWVAELEWSLLAYAGSNDVGSIARVVAESLVDRPRLLTLQARAAAILERRVSEALLFDFKIRLLGEAERLGGALRQAIPGLVENRVIRCLVALNALASGMWAMSNTAPTLKGVLERPELALIRVDLRRDLTSAVAALLHGFIATASEEKGSNDGDK